MPQARGAGFENRNCQIPTFDPSVPALGGVGETIYRCIIQDNIRYKITCTPLLLNALKCSLLIYAKKVKPALNCMHVWKMHDELSDLLPVQVYQLHALMHRCMCIRCYT